MKTRRFSKWIDGGLWGGYLANMVFRYKIGDVYVYLPLSDALERLEKDTERSSKAIEEKEHQIDEISNEMGDLKKSLYAKFGNAINLEV